MFGYFTYLKHKVSDFIYDTKKCIFSGMWEFQFKLSFIGNKQGTERVLGL